jgi:hypothetical protein
VEDSISVQVLSGILTVSWRCKGDDDDNSTSSGDRHERTTSFPDFFFFFSFFFPQHTEKTWVGNVVDMGEDDDEDEDAS